MCNCFTVHVCVLYVCRDIQRGFKGLKSRARSMSYGELAETTLVCILNDSAIRFTKTKRTYKSLDSKEGSCRPHLLTDGPCAALGDMRHGHAVVVHGRRGLGCVRVRVRVDLAREHGEGGREASSRAGKTLTHSALLHSCDASCDVRTAVNI